MDGDPNQVPTRREAIRLTGSLVAGAVGASLIASSAAQAQDKAGPGNVGPGGLKVALIDIGVIFKGYKRKDDLERSINAKKEKLENQYRDQASTIEGLRKQFDLLKEGSQMWRDKRKDLRLEAKKMEVMRESMDEELKLEVENLTLMILDEIEAKVREFGKSQGYDIVLKVDSKGWGDERFQERIFRAQVSSVLYYDPRLDVTPTVLAALNDPGWIKQQQDKQLREGGAPNGPTPPAPGPPK